MKETALLLSRKEITALVAALRYWQDEMGPHGPESALPYFEGLDADPLTPDEIGTLLNRLIQETGSATDG